MWFDFLIWGFGRNFKTGCRVYKQSHNEVALRFTMINLALQKICWSFVCSSSNSFGTLWNIFLSEIPVAAEIFFPKGIHRVAAPAAQWGGCLMMQPAMKFWRRSQRALTQFGANLIPNQNDHKKNQKMHHTACPTIMVNQLKFKVIQEQNFGDFVNKIDRGTLDQAFFWTSFVYVLSCFYPNSKFNLGPPLYEYRYCIYTYYI